MKRCFSGDVKETELSETYSFDEPVDRRHSYSYKWDVGEDELPMWVADMDFETAPCVKRALIERAQHGVFGYSVTPDEYFLSISDFWADRYGWRPPASEMVFSIGVVATLSSAVRKLTTPGEKIVIQPPVYNIFYNCILNNGRNVLENKLVYENGAYRMDLNDLEKKLSDPQATMMILCNPHNPIGKIWTREELAAVGELCNKYGVTLISDEIHSPLTDPGKCYVPFASVNRTCRDISAVCLSASKAFNLAGLQSSVVVAHDPRLRHKLWRGINTDEVGEPGAFATVGSIAALREGREWLDSLRQYIAGNKELVRAFISCEIPSLRVVASDATYLLWIDISSLSSDSVAFASEVRRLTGLYLSDGAEYGPGGECFLRMNVATRRELVEDGCRRLKRAVELIGSVSDKT